MSELCIPSFAELSLYWRCSILLFFPSVSVWRSVIFVPQPVTPAMASCLSEMTARSQNKQAKAEGTV